MGRMVTSPVQLTALIVCLSLKLIAKLSDKPQAMSTAIQDSKASSMANPGKLFAVEVMTFKGPS